MAWRWDSHGDRGDPREEPGVGPASATVTASSARSPITSEGRQVGDLGAVKGQGLRDEVRNGPATFDLLQLDLVGRLHHERLVLGHGLLPWLIAPWFSCRETSLVRPSRASTFKTRSVCWRGAVAVRGGFTPLDDVEWTQRDAGPHELGRPARAQAGEYRPPMRSGRRIP